MSTGTVLVIGGDEVIDGDDVMKGDNAMKGDPAIFCCRIPVSGSVEMLRASDAQLLN